VVAHEEADEARLELTRLEQAIAESTAEGNTYVTAALHFRAAQICLARSDQDLSTRELALTHLWASWQLQPEDLDIRTVLAHYLERGDQMEEVAGLYSSTADHIRNTAERARLLLRAADLLGRCGEPGEGLAVLKRLETGDDAELTRERARLLRRWLPSASTAEVRREILSLLVDDLAGDERFELAVELAGELEQAGRDEEAGRFYLEALAIRPSDARALDPVRARLAAAGDHEQLSDVLERAARSASQPQRQLVLLRELAELVEVKRGEPERAARFWWKAWELDPTSPDEPARLKALYTRLEQWPSYRRVLLREILHAPNTAAKVAAYRELARLQLEVFDDHMSAARTYGYILHLLPDDAQALEARIEIFEQKMLVDQLTLALRRYAAHTRDPQTRDALHRRLARLEARLPDPSYLLRTVRRLDPTATANRELVRELRAQPQAAGRPLGRQLGLLLLKMERKAGTDAPSCIELALELGREGVADGDASSAVECFRQVLELEPDHPEARRTLAQLARRGEPEEPTARELAEQADGLLPEQPARAVRLLIQAARLVQREGKNPEVAVGYLRRALEYCPSSPVPELQLLEEALRSAGLLVELATLLEHQAAVETQPDRRKDTLRALAVLRRESLNDPEGALLALSKVRAIDPLDAEVTEEVRQLHTQLGNHGALARVLEDLLQPSRGGERIPLLAELGSLYAHRLGDRQAALQRYGELLALVPSHDEALSYCRAHDEATGNYRSVAVMLCRAAEAADDPLARAEIHREIAQIAEKRLSDLDFAVTHWRAVVELCPADSAPRAELKRLLAQVGRWPDLERVLLSEVSRSLRPEEKVPIYFELARIAFGELGDDRRASSYLRNALQLAPENTSVLNQLEAIYERLGHWRELAAVLRRHADVVDDAEEKIRLLLRAARVLFVHLGRDEEALAVCRLIRETRPTDRGAATLMAEILGKRGKWREKAALLREQIAGETDPPELGRLHLELGRLMLDKLQDNEEAASHFELALELSSGAAEILPLLRQLYESLGRWDLLVELIHKRAAAEGISSAERALALCEIGRIRREQLGDLQGAKEAYERAIHLAPEHHEALRALRSLAATQEQWRELVALSRRELQLTEDDSERARLLVEIGELQYRHLERPNAAAESLEQALEADPNNTRAAELLGVIYFETEDWERADQLLERVVGSGMELGNLHEYYYRLGYANERLGREDDAFSHYVKSFGREPMYLPTLTRLVDLCYTRNQWENTLRIGEAIVTTYASQKSPGELAELHVRIGLCQLHLAQQEVAVKQLQNMILEHGQVPSTPADAWVDAAESWAATPVESTLLGRVNPDVLSKVVKAMERALGQVPSHPGALQVLAALSISRRDWERSLRYIERTVEAISETPRQQVRLLVCAGDVAHKHLLSAARAQVYYRAALDILPGSELARDRLDMLEVTPARAELPAPPAPRGRQATPPPPPPLPAEPAVSQTPTKPLPGIMPPLPDDAEEDPPPVVRPAPRSRPFRPDED